MKLCEGSEMWIGYSAAYHFVRSDADLDSVLQRMHGFLRVVRLWGKKVVLGAKAVLVNSSMIWQKSKHYEKYSEECSLGFTHLCKPTMQLRGAHGGRRTNVIKYSFVAWWTWRGSQRRMDMRLLRMPVCKSVAKGQQSPRTFLVNQLCAWHYKIRIIADLRRLDSFWLTDWNAASLPPQLSSLWFANNILLWFFLYHLKYLVRLMHVPSTVVNLLSEQPYTRRSENSTIDISQAQQRSSYYALFPYVL